MRADRYNRGRWDGFKDGVGFMGLVYIGLYILKLMIG